MFSGFREIFQNFEPYDPGDEISLNVVIVNVKVEFQQQFTEQYFTIEDFEFQNIESIEYYPFGIGNENKTNGYIKVYLKEAGREQVLEAVEHFKTLSFAYNATVKSIYAVDKISVTIKEDFHQKFIEQKFSLEDFKWSNVESITYGTWYEYEYQPSFGVMTIHLKEYGKQQVIDAVEHFRRFNFVEYAQVSGYWQID
jgi:hypothetical protein